MDYRPIKRKINGDDYAIVGPLPGIDPRLHCRMQTYFIERNGSKELIAERISLGDKCSFLFAYLKERQRAPLDRKMTVILDQILAELDE